MQLFFLSNIVITLMAIFYNRYGKSNISAKLTLSSFALSCWITPFTLIRDYLPQEAAVNIPWLVPLQSNIDLVVSIPVQTSWLSQLTILHVFVFTSVIGLCFLSVRIFKHKQWVNKLKNDPQKKLVLEHHGIPVYQTNQINNALLIGYSKPSIWINSHLVTSPYFEIIIKHEATHIENRDNYWLAIMEVIRAVYWWNPLTKILIENIKVHIETRCDYKTSHYFKKGIYRQKLTDLILNQFIQNQQPVSHTGFTSAAISKNSNVKRLKTLTEKQTMNLLSKFTVTGLLVSGLTILTLPVSSVNSFASNKTSIASPNAEPNKAKGVMLELNIIKISNHSNEVNTKKLEASIWTHFNNIGQVNFNEMWELQIVATERNEQDIYLDMKLFSIESVNARQLVSEPKLLVTNNRAAEIEFGDEKGNTIHFKITPIKMENPSNQT